MHVCVCVCVHVYVCVVSRCLSVCVRVCVGGVLWHGCAYTRACVCVYARVRASTYLRSSIIAQPVAVGSNRDSTLNVHLDAIAHTAHGNVHLNCSRFVLHIAIFHLIVTNSPYIC